MKFIIKTKQLREQQLCASYAFAYIHTYAHLCDKLTDDHFNNIASLIYLKYTNII